MIQSVWLNLRHTTTWRSMPLDRTLAQMFPPAALWPLVTPTSLVSSLHQWRRLTLHPTSFFQALSRQPTTLTAPSKDPTISMSPPGWWQVIQVCMSPLYWVIVFDRPWVDTRYYWNLSKHIFRYNHQNAGNVTGLVNNIHTVDECRPSPSFESLFRTEHTTKRSPSTHS